MHEDQAQAMESRLFVNALRKGFEVLETFHAVRSLSLQEITQRTGLDKSASQRMCHTLVTLGYLQQCPQTRRFELAPKVLGLSYEFLRHHPLVERATPYLIELRRQCDERVDLSLFSDHQLVYVQRHQSQRELFYTTLIGRRVPLYCSAGGRAVLAALPPDEARRHLAQEKLALITRQTLTDPEKIWSEVETARAQGWAMANSEVIENELVFAAAILGPDRRPVGAIHVACNASHASAEDFAEKIVPNLLSTVQILS